MSTSEQELAVQRRSDFGKNAARRARKKGLIPAVIYSKGKVGDPVYVNTGDWEVIAGHGHNLVYLKDGDKTRAALIKEAQFNVLKNHYIHVDFMEVDLNAKIKAEVSVRSIGEAYGAAHGGILEQNFHVLQVECKAADLPEVIEVDVTKLNIGDGIKVAELQLPAGVVVLDDPEELVFHVIHEAKEEEASAPAEGEAAAEPEIANAKGGDKEKDAEAASEKK